MAIRQRPNWMLYGAYGRTGRSILDEALRRGHRPVLAGRDAAQLADLARETGLKTECLQLDDGRALRAALSSVDSLLLAAGPYSHTGPVMRAACIDAGCSYLDVNAEIDDFVAALDCDQRARAAGVAVIPGVGYGVVFAECLAAQVATRLPSATWLRLSLATRTAGSSRAATLSKAAALQTHPIAFATWRAPRADANGMRFAAAPLAELVAAQRSTGIRNIVTGIPMSRLAAVVMRVGGPVIGRVLQWQASRSRATKGPALPNPTGSMRSRVWAEAGDDSGAYVAARLESGEGYQAAAAAAVLAVERQLQERRAGAFTPVQAFGPGFAGLVPGTRIEEL
jgi:short subunit dehydrogenase-like uncharacterized protein